MRTFLSILATAALLIFVGEPPATAFERVDGDDEPVTVRNGMHTCPRGYFVTGVHVANNDLLCNGYFGYTMNPEVVRSFRLIVGNRNFVRCGANEFVTGVHVGNQTLSCSSFAGSAHGDYNPTLGAMFIDEPPGQTVRANMHACPAGSVLVGADWNRNSFLCAGVRFCGDNAMCSSGLSCEKERILGGPLRSLIGVCRNTGFVRLKEGNSCTQGSVGTLTDRPGTVARLTSIDWIPNDEARSVELSNVRPGAVIRIFDNSGGSFNDDWTEIRVHNRTPNGYCVPTFESSFFDGIVTVTYHRKNGLDGKVSRVQIVQ